MNKTKFNYLVDFLAAICLLVVANTGLIIFFFLPEGVRRGGYLEFFGVSKKTYVDIHNWAGIIFIILVIIHIILHWNWIACTTKNFFRKEATISNQDSCQKNS